MMNRRPLVAANWKMNGTRASAGALLGEFKQGLAGAAVEVLVCAPYVHLPLAARELAGSDISLGAQNVSEYAAGAYTGEISAAMLRECGCRYVIVGHSERRHVLGETNARVADKFCRAREQGLRVVLCLGEQLQERQGGVTEQVLAEQLDAVVNQAGVAALADAALAYEPVWAIGTGLSATPEQAQEAHSFIRLQVARHDDQLAAGLRILYGGSLKPGNAAGLFAMADVDGGLVGGASLQADEFLAICQAAGEPAQTS